MSNVISDTSCQLVNASFQLNLIKWSINQDFLGNRNLTKIV